MAYVKGCSHSYCRMVWKHAFIQDGRNTRWSKGCWRCETFTFQHFVLPLQQTTFSKTTYCVSVAALINNPCLQQPCKTGNICRSSNDDSRETQQGFESHLFDFGEGRWVPSILEHCSNFEILNEKQEAPTPVICNASLSMSHTV